MDALSYLTFRPVGGWAALQAPISPLRPHLFAFAVCIAAYYLARTILRRRHRSRLAGLLSPLPQPAAALAQVDSHVLRALREASPDLAGRWLGDDPGGWAEGVALDGSGRRVESLRLEWLAELTCLPAEIGRLSALCSLSLSGCERLEGLPPEIGRLKCLARLSLAGCERLASLPPELGGLASLAVLNLYGCEQLEALPLELTRITSLTTLNLVGCVCLTSPPPETHAYPARQLLAAIAREACSEILDSDTIVQPTAALSDALCLHVVTDDASATLLGAAVQAKPWIAELTSSTGERAIDLASLPCRRAMQAALYLLGRFEVVRGPPLHFSATSAVLAADDHADREVRHRRCLKAMHGQAQARVAPPCPTTLCVWRNLPYLTLPYLTLAQALAELRGRHGLNPTFVVRVLAVYADGDVDDEAFEALHSAAVPLGATAAREAGLSDGLSRVLVSRRSGGGGADFASPHQYLLVMELAERSLCATLSHDRVAGHDIFLARKIAADLATALDHLHANGRIHADLKPLNAVRVDSSWRLIDLDVSCAIGAAFGAKPPSSAFCPPEVAQALLACRPGEPISYTADIAFDLWSFGVVLYHLTFGRSLWHADQGDGIARDDLQKLARWRPVHLEREMRRAVSSPSDEQRCAADLIRKLLDPSAAERVAHFGGADGTMMRVMEHPFFQGRDLDAATLEEIKQQTARILEIGEEQRTELARTREILLKGIFEATEVTTPTAFVVLREKLPPPPTMRERAELQELLASGGEIADQWKGRLDEGIEWLQGLRAFGSSGAADSDGNSDSVFEKIREAFSSLVSGPAMYLYLLDELTGEPVIPADGSYPITISTPAALVPRLLPLMQVGMRAMCVYHGVSGVARMFGCPLPAVPQSWREGAQTTVELLKQESSAEAFGSVHRAAMRTDDGEQRCEKGPNLPPVSYG